MKKASTLTIGILTCLLYGIVMLPFVHFHAETTHYDVETKHTHSGKLDVLNFSPSSAFNNNICYKTETVESLEIKCVLETNNKKKKGSKTFGVHNGAYSYPSKYHLLPIRKRNESYFTWNYYSFPSTISPPVSTIYHHNWA
ncbi:MAG: hypothetical protein HQK84_09490 [Nitrospinae bacterium]|nr:hypothetical protein [Nitrospinota bacterium]